MTAPEWVALLEAAEARRVREYEAAQGLLRAQDDTIRRQRAEIDRLRERLVQS